jgi:hypothetical protein
MGDEQLRMNTHRTRNTKLFAPFVPIGFVLSIISGGFFAIDYIGYPNAPTPIAPYLLLPTGLLFVVIGKRLTDGRWEGVPEFLHATLALVGLTYMCFSVKYALAGRSIHRYPAGLYLIISGIFIISRLLAKHHVRLRTAMQRSR